MFWQVFVLCYQIWYAWQVTHFFLTIQLLVIFKRAGSQEHPSSIAPYRAVMAGQPCRHPSPWRAIHPSIHVRTAIDENHTFFTNLFVLTALTSKFLNCLLRTLDQDLWMSFVQNANFYRYMFCNDSRCNVVINSLTELIQNNTSQEFS